MQDTLNQAQDVIDRRMREVYYLSLFNCLAIILLFLYMLLS